MWFDLLAVDIKMNLFQQSEEGEGIKNYLLCLNYALLLSEINPCFKSKENE